MTLVTITFIRLFLEEFGDLQGGNQQQRKSHGGGAEKNAPDHADPGGIPWQIVAGPRLEQSFDEIGRNNRHQAREQSAEHGGHQRPGHDVEEVSQEGHNLVLGRQFMPLRDFFQPCFGRFCLVVQKFDPGKGAA